MLLYVKRLVSAIFFIAVWCLHGYTLTSQSAVFPGTEWKVRSPESQGIDVAKLEAALKYLESQCGDNGIRETVVIRNGYLIYEGSDSRVQQYCIRIADRGRKMFITGYRCEI